MTANRQLNINAVGDLTKFSRLYRYLPWSRLHTMLQMGVFEFRSPFSWPDKTEWLWTNQIREKLNTNIYCACWTRNRISEAPWRIYSPKPKMDPLVRISTTLNRIQQSFIDDSETVAQAQLINVEYVQDGTLESLFHQLRGSESQFMSATEFLQYKRYPYKWEKESRLMVVASSSGGQTLQVKCRFKKLLTRVLISPHAKESVSEDIKNQLTDLGYKDIAKKSLLLALPKSLRPYAKRHQIM